MRRRAFITLLGGAAAWPIVARAEQVGKVYRIGVISAGSNLMADTSSALVEGLRELGWIEGENIVIERRYAENRSGRLPELAAELVRLDVHVIVAIGTLAPLAAKQATSTIPIVMTATGDPVGAGLVASLAQPGGNVTGLSLMAPDLAGKRLELLKELVPSISHVAVLWNAANPYSALVFRETASAAQALRMEIQSLEVRSPADFGGALDTAKRQDALFTVEDPLTVTYRKEIANFAMVNRMPAIYGLREFAEAGGLMSYGANLVDLFRRAGTYVDKILKGAKPANLPVEQPTKFDFVINLRTARTLGLSVPDRLLALADEVIE